MNVLVLALVAAIATGGFFVVQERIRRRRLKVAGVDLEVSSVQIDRQMPEGLTIYTVYKLSRIQWLTAFVAAGLIFGIVGYLFYHNLVAAILCFGAGTLYPKFRREALLLKRRTELSLQFKQALYSISSSLAAGRSVENSFHEVIQDLQLLYPDANTDLIREFRIIRSRLENGEPIEQALLDLSRRAGIEDVTNFAEVFSACKRTGGDLVEVVRRTSNLIGEKMDVKQEIAVMVAQKKFESKIIMLAPVGFLAFLNMSAPEFMQPMYQGFGFVVSTFVLLGLVVCSAWILKIMDIRV
ncbi:type II secretion system F family protein [Paenibacillus sp. GCM10027629]|uniref:type II secretion system F family protein n=1 Tax=Paenibacillus sp. GCM10027629 TaxID=3273414 RepID=UPI00363DD6BB